MRKLNCKKLIAVVVMLCISVFSFAQNADKQTDFMRSNGRIYVVVAVMVTILIGLILYMIRMDRKLSKLEKEN